MKPAGFSYVRPQSLSDALDVLAEHGPDARVIAGGQSLMPMMALRVAQPAVLVDITRLPELHGISHQQGVVRVGALTRHAQLLNNPVVARALPLLSLALPYVAHAAIRNRGTLGGSLALADPAAELPACSLALDATVHIAGRDRTREVLAGDFFQGLYSTALRDGELLTAVSFPELQPDDRVYFDEVSRRRGDYAIAGLAAVALAGGALRLAYLGCGDRPLRARSAERLLAGMRVSDPVPERAKLRQALQADLDPPSDLQADSQTRLHLATVLLERALRAWFAAP